LASRLRDKLAGPQDDMVVPDPEPNDSPFVVHEDADDAGPLGDPDKAAQLFGRGTDPWTGRSLQLLTDRVIEHDFVDLESEGGLKIETRLIGETKQNDGPYVYLRGEFIGGFNALHELDRLGQLEVRTLPESERNASRGRTRIVVAPRGPEERPVGEVGMPEDRK
jgi:glutaredoxin